MEQYISGEDTQVAWYVLSAIYKKEMVVRDELRVRGFETYLPLHYELTRGRHPRRLLRPAISALVFVKATYQQLLEYKATTRYSPYIYLRTTRQGNNWVPIVVSERDMQNFIRVTSLEEVGLEYFRPEELRLEKGEKVKIMDGVFAGIVGEVVKLPHKRGDYLVVEIAGVTTVAARLKPAFVQPLCRKVARSTHVESDVARLDMLACRLLYDMPDDDLSFEARSMVTSEMRTLWQALDGCKTVLPLDKAACALAHFLAALVLGEPSEAYAQQLASVTPKLRSVSLLRLRTSMYLFLCCGDEASGQFVNDTLARWDREKLSEAQRQVASEWHKAQRRFAR